MNDLVYLTNVLKNRKYSIDKINKITNKLNQKVYYQMGGDPDIKWDPLLCGYKNIIDKFKILNDPEFSELIDTMTEIVSIFEKKEN
jgi:hypothetical protein